PAPSRNSTTTRFLAGSNGIAFIVAAETANVAVSFGAMRFALPPITAPVAGSVSRTMRLGEDAPLLVAVPGMTSAALPAVIAATAKPPRRGNGGRVGVLIVARAVASVPLTLAFRMPSLVAVAATATMSGVGVTDADSSSVFTPGIGVTRPAIPGAKS